MLTVSALRRLHICVSFELPDGQCVALQGRSGVGKTLLLRAIADLDGHVWEYTWIDLSQMPSE